MSESSILSNQRIDYVTTSLKGALGAVPVIGSALAEAVGALIPNQRIDRLADFAQRLAEKIDEQNQEILRKRILEPEGADILEEGLWQSARALSAERRERIACVVKNGLTQSEIDLIGTKKVLQLLSQINDLELILLRTLATDFRNQDAAFKRRFAPLVNPERIAITAPVEAHDAQAISESMRTQLTQLGLIRPKYPKTTKGISPEFDPSRGGFRITGHEITPLGQLLLRASDFAPDDISAWYPFTNTDVKRSD